MFESLPLGAIYSVLKDLGARILPPRKLSNSERLARRLKWKRELEARIVDSHRRSLRCEIYIRDMNRLDDYPEPTKPKRGSSCFRVGLVGATHRGILVKVEPFSEKLIRHRDGQHWRFIKKDDPDDQDQILVALLATIPYEVIDSVDWDGDEYTWFPHVFCSFQYRGAPFEHLAFYSKHPGAHPDNSPYYKEVELFDDVCTFSSDPGDPIKEITGLL